MDETERMDSNILKQQGQNLGPQQQREQRQQQQAQHQRMADAAVALLEHWNKLREVRVLP